MAILEAFLKYKYHILSSILLCAAASALVLLAPRFVTVLAYFWPLCISTTVFLVAVFVFGHTLPTPADSSAEKAGEGLLDYVASQAEPVDLSSETFETDENYHHLTTEAS